MNRTVQGNFITQDHPYVFLGGSLIALLGLSLLAGEPHSLSFLTDNLPAAICRIIFWGFLALSALALVIKLTNGRNYRSTFLCTPGMKLISRWFSYFVVLACLLTLVDRVLLQLVYTVQTCMQLEKNPQGFGSSMIYMSVKSKDILLAGVWTTVRIALLGTAIAFVLSIFMVFLRIQEPDKRDNDFVKALKWLASHFSRFYIFVIRGTPMMVQAIDRGQTEAARSLGMSNWQSMIKVVFPQAVKNSIPAIGNEFIINIKDSSVLSVIGVMDLMYATKSVSGIYFRSLEIYCVAAILYLILTWLSSKLLQYLGKKLDTPVKGIPSSN